MINLQQSLLSTIDATLQKIRIQGAGQKDAAKISPVLMQYLCRALFKDKVLSMSVESFKQEFLANWLLEVKSGNCTNPRVTLVLRNIQDHFFTVDMLWSQQEQRVFAFVIDSINQTTTLEEDLRPGMGSTTFVRIFGRDENAKNIQSTIQEDCGSLGLHSTVSFVTKFPGEWQTIRQSQYDDGSCAFFSLYYALCVQAYEQGEYPSFLSQIERNFGYVESHHKDEGAYNYAAHYNRDGNRSMPLSWDYMPFSMLVPIQTKTGVMSILEAREAEVEPQSEKAYRKVKAIAAKTKERNTYVIDFAKWVLEFGRLRLERQANFGRIDYIFGEERWHSQRYMLNFLLAVDQTQNGSRFVEDWLVWMLENPKKRMANREQIGQWMRYIDRFNLPELREIAVTVSSPGSAEEGFFDEDEELRPLGQMLGSHLNNYLDNKGPVAKAGLPLWFLLKESNRKSLCSSSGKIDKKAVAAAAKLISDGMVSRPQPTVTDQHATSEGMPPLHLSAFEPAIFGASTYRRKESRMETLSLTKLTFLLSAQKNQGSATFLEEHEGMGVRESWPITVKA